MTIKINGNQGIGLMRPMEGTQGAKDSRKANPAKGGDKVDFSNVLQNVSQSRQTASQPNVERGEKVQALKQQVAEGSYRPDLTKVAASLLKYIAEGK